MATKPKTVAVNAVSGDIVLDIMNPWNGHTYQRTKQNVVVNMNNELITADVYTDVEWPDHTFLLVKRRIKVERLEDIVPVKDKPAPITPH